MIACGWCHRPTRPERQCSECGHADPARPWAQRGMEPPDRPEPTGGRPRLDADDVQRRLREARTAISRSGRPATTDALAEALDVSPRTVRRWQQGTE